MIRTAIAVMSAIPVVCCWVVLAQPAQERPSFEVASVKAMLVDDHRAGPRRGIGISWQDLLATGVGALIQLI